MKVLGRKNNSNFSYFLMKYVKNKYQCEDNETNSNVGIHFFYNSQEYIVPFSDTIGSFYCNKHITLSDKSALFYFNVGDISFFANNKRYFPLSYIYEIVRAKPNSAIYNGFTTSLYNNYTTVSSSQYKGTKYYNNMKINISYSVIADQRKYSSYKWWLNTQLTRSVFYYGEEQFTTSDSAITSVNSPSANNRYSQTASITLNPKNRNTNTYRVAFSFRVNDYYGMIYFTDGESDETIDINVRCGDTYDNTPSPPSTGGGSSGEH